MPDIFDKYSHGRPDIEPIIYAYSDVNYPGCLKVGDTTREIEKRMKEHYPTLLPTEKPPYTVELTMPALYADGTRFRDYTVHRMLEKRGIKKIKGEWFKCSIQDVRAAVMAVYISSVDLEVKRTNTFGMRPEQFDAVNKTKAFFEDEVKRNPSATPKFLWNCKMRFGKTFTAYQLAKAMDLKKILVLTFKPAVESAWEEDLETHIDFKGWQEYKINVCAGSKAGIGLAALPPVRESMQNPLQTKTITLSCGKLTTGVTVKPWSGIFMLRNLSSPETYFQAAFRVQSPWEVEGEKGEKVIMKPECYVFDFALDRALKQVSDYGCRLNVKESNPEKKISEFINFLPVLAYDGSSMKPVNAKEILDITMSGTSATLLARRWESALLVNVDNETLKRLADNPEAMAALMSIEGFRSLNQDINTIINKSESVKKAKKDAAEKGEELSKEKKKELSEEEKEYKSKRKQIQEKLIKFATRVPIFMYLTDFREYSLKDVITQFEPGLFKKVTGLSVKDFELLVSLGVFNDELMNDAVYNFKRYEDSSLEYAGIRMHAENEDVGLFSTVISRDDYEQMAKQQGSSMEVMTNSAPQEEKDEKGNITPFYSRKNEKKDLKPSRKPYIVKPKVADRVAESAQYGSKKTPVIHIGDRVFHKKFGEGRIIGIEDTRFTAEFSMGTKKLGTDVVFKNGIVKLIGGGN